LPSKLEKLSNSKMISLRSGQKYGSFANHPQEDERDDGDCPTGGVSKKKLGLCVICCGILLVVFNKLEQFAGSRPESDVLAAEENQYRNIISSGTASTSDDSSNKPEFAIDGKPGTSFNWNKGFWKLSFTDLAYIRNVKLTFGRYGKTLCNDMILDVLDESKNVLFSTGLNIPCTGSRYREANVFINMKGHSVRVTNKKKKKMQLEEVQVFGSVNNVLYDDVLSLQVNSIDRQWLSGERGSNAGDHWGVWSKNFFESEYEQNYPRSYKWEVRRTLDDQSNNVKGLCVKYGDVFYLRKATLFWLSGGIDSLNPREPDGNVFTRDPLKSADEATPPSYKWTVHSSVGDGTLSFVDEQKGSCVKYDTIIYIQLNPPGVGGFLSGNRNANHAYFSDEGVRTQDPTGVHESPEFMKHYQWIIRRPIDDGTTDFTRPV